MRRTMGWGATPGRGHDPHTEARQSLVCVKLRLGFRTGVKRVYVCFKEKGKVEDIAEDEELTAGWNHVCILGNFYSMIINGNG